MYDADVGGSRNRAGSVSDLICKLMLALQPFLHDILLDNRLNSLLECLLQV